MKNQYQPSLVNIGDPLKPLSDPEIAREFIRHGEQISLKVEGGRPVARTATAAAEEDPCRFCPDRNRREALHG